MNYRKNYQDCVLRATVERDMRITDYEKGTTLRDICISLTIDEADELRIYLNKLVKDPHLSRAHLSEVKGFELDKEITIAVDGSGLSPKTFKAANS